MSTQLISSVCRRHESSLLSARGVRITETRMDNRQCPTETYGLYDSFSRAVTIAHTKADIARRHPMPATQTPIPIAAVA